ncbi:hypothetical protein OPV22_033620 [Ensete ventricosum]|uniref:Uncharacterized protein n=1 Tax=Ensete ventricosum TaxID=4639 RepID=A0AAV8Q2J1_ENSVE|nr:hypothetical protein OPV22_033620 [Ensete ventricosum]
MAVTVPPKRCFWWVGYIFSFSFPSDNEEPQNRAGAASTWSSCLNMLIPSSKITTKHTSSTLSSSILGSMLSW